MKKINIPTRPELKYAKGSSKPYSFRLPEKLIERLDKDAKSKGYDRTELLKLIIDLYLQQEDEE